MGFELQILGKSIFNTILKPNKCDKRTHLFFQWNCDYIKTTDGAQADWCGRIASDKFIVRNVFSYLRSQQSERNVDDLISKGDRCPDTYSYTSGSHNRREPKTQPIYRSHRDLLMAILLNNTNSNTLCHNK